MADLIYEHRYDDGNKAIVVLFGEGGIGIGLGNEKPELNIHLQELKKLKKVGEFLTNEEIMDNFKNPKNPNEVILHFPYLSLSTCSMISLLLRAISVSGYYKAHFDL